VFRHISIVYSAARASIVFSWKFPFKLTVPAVDLLVVSLLLFTFAFYVYLCFVSSVLSFSCRLSSDPSTCSSRTCPQSFFVRSIFLVFYLTYSCYFLLSPTIDHVWICYWIVCGKRGTGVSVQYLVSDRYCCSNEYLKLLYIELTISFLIGRKCTVNFRNPRLWRHNCRLFNSHVKVTGNHVKVTGNHVVYDRGAWFLRVIMSSSLASPSASADNPYLDLDHSGYHKNLIQ